MSGLPTKNDAIAEGQSRIAAEGRAVWDRRKARKRGSTSLSVLVPAYNEQYLIEASLQRLWVLNDSPRLDHIKVIVVDDCSTDATQSALERFRKTIESNQDFKKFSWVWLHARKESR